MTERGSVVANKNNIAQVRIGRNSACASCGKCGMTEKQKHVDFYVENTLNAKVGDIVEVEIPETNSTPRFGGVHFTPCACIGVDVCRLCLELEGMGCFVDVCRRTCCGLRPVGGHRQIAPLQMDANAHNEKHLLFRGGATTVVCLSDEKRHSTTQRVFQCVAFVAAFD